MPDEPSLFQLLREDIAAFRRETNERLDKLVSQDAFEAERRRRDELHASLIQDIAEERTARTADIERERASRIAAVKEERDARDKVVLDLQAKNAATGLWIRWGIGFVVGLPAAGIALWAIFQKGIGG
ncbi:hypothetical protein IT072_02320 [Leifsonia sp. ZF2019]|uniref:hypothetical protein n=1 Tax=Leifsonia sp. ZF2019 TaxID=2781978 RepID=UPI001CBAD09F|nr:hypothetical protein [Leifsonia sp. ZF2019]UAJ78302.1 hypothetical protein IT072_13645 [Leifsonia sp. ZF2019]UAJ79932.1 hypothetical protein IT072_02320 [Leifsonia sp. ZF2019]